MNINYEERENAKESTYLEQLYRNSSCTYRRDLQLLKQRLQQAFHQSERFKGTATGETVNTSTGFSRSQKQIIIARHTNKKETKIFLIYCIRKFRVEQLQSHI
jgi:hypothetical protein